MTQVLNAGPRPTEALGRAAVVMNPRSGDGRVERFRLVEAAERLGAEVLLTGPGEDAGALARRALADGARVLGVAGGDGTVSTVAAVAVEARLPLLVVPAGTRNHFARDLGLDIVDPAAALAALHGGELIGVDVGDAGGRTFVNNVSFGLYAAALLVPDYREAKARAMVSVARPYLEGREWVDVDVDTPDGVIDRPQVLLISNNPYHLATPRYLGYRFGLDGGTLGAIAFKRSPGSRPDPLPRVLRTMAEGGATSRGDEVHVWSAPRIVLRGTATSVTAGIDGEAVTLPLPLTCAIRPRALRVLVPKDRPGMPDEPHPPRPRTR